MSKISPTALTHFHLRPAELGHIIPVSTIKRQEGTPTRRRKEATKMPPLRGLFRRTPKPPPPSSGKPTLTSSPSHPQYKFPQSQDQRTAEEAPNPRAQSEPGPKTERARSRRTDGKQESGKYDELIDSLALSLPAPLFILIAFDPGW